MRSSIRNQLLAPLLTLLAGVIGVSTWTAYASAHRAWQQLETQVRNVGRVLATGQFPITHSVLAQTHGLSGAEFYFRPEQGQTISTLPLAEPLSNLRPEALTDSWQELGLGTRVVLDGQVFFCTGVHLGPPRVGTLYILYPESLWRDALWEAVRPSLLLGSVVGLASLVLAFAVSQRMSRRIGELERRTRQIAAGDFRPMPLSGRPDELRDLGQSINDMAQRLTQLQQAVQQGERLRLLGQVSGGLAHQLRNSATGARLALQLHARTCSGGDAEALDVALRQLTLLEANVQRFLELGRTAQEHVAVPCSLSDLMDEAVQLLRPQCRHLGTALDWHRPEGALNLVGDPGQLRHLLQNLLQNAVEAAGPGGMVKVNAGKKNGQLWIEVHDSGPGPALEVAERLFEPFATGKVGGVGLGLAVARQAAEMHKGQITWKREGHWTVFRIELGISKA